MGTCTCNGCGQGICRKDSDIQPTFVGGSTDDKVPPAHGLVNLFDDELTKDPFLHTHDTPEDTTSASHCAGAVARESGETAEDGADAFELLLHEARFMEASRRLPQVQETALAEQRLDENHWERVRLITGRCRNLLAVAGRGASGYIGGGKAPGGAEWNYAIEGSNVRARMVQMCHVDLIRAVAGMAEIDMTGDAPFTQSSRLRKMTFAGFFGSSKSQGDASPATEAAVQRCDSHASVVSAKRLMGFRHDIVEARELSFEGSTPVDTVWQTITADPNIHTKADDIFSSTIIDLIDEPTRSMCILVHPPPASMTLPPPRPKHGRCAFMQVLVLLEPLGELPHGSLRASGATVPIRITRIFEVEMTYAVRKILQFMPTMVLRGLANKLAKEEEAGISSYLQDSEILTTLIESGPRAELYERLRARWAKLPGPGR